MTLIERIEQASLGLAVAAISGGVSCAWWLVRRIFTNQKQIEMLQKSLEDRDKQRDEDREALADVRTDVREMRNEMRVILHRR
jgi:hypothetical protein